MSEDFRGLLARLEAAGILRRIKREVDPRHFSTLLEQARGPLLFERVKGYEHPAVGNVAGNRRCVTEGLRVGDRDVGRRMLQAIERPIAPVMVSTAPCQENASDTPKAASSQRPSGPSLPNSSSSR